MNFFIQFQLSSVMIICILLSVNVLDILFIRVADPHHLNADLDPAPHQCYSNLRPTGPQILQGSTFSLNASIVSVHCPPQLFFEPLKPLNFDFNADPGFNILLLLTYFTWVTWWLISVGPGGSSLEMLLASVASARASHQSRKSSKRVQA
jgi:hypothetical protein